MRENEHLWSFSRAKLQVLNFENNTLKRRLKIFVNQGEKKSEVKLAWENIENSSLRMCCIYMIVANTVGTKISNFPWFYTYYDPQNNLD